MKTRLLVLGGVLQFVSVSVAAQSSVNVYGIVNTGVNYTSNEAGKSISRVVDGGMQASRLGFKGDEDLGAGYRGIFTLEVGFSSDTGVLGQSSTSGTTTTSRIFGRQSLVGLSSPWGTVSLGRQYDSMYDLRNYSGIAYVSSYAARPWSGSTLVGNNGSSNDFDRLVGTRVDNSVKISSQNFSGFTISGMYGLGENAGSTLPGSTVSGNLRYVSGPMDVGISYTDRRDGTVNSAYKNWGVGGSYQIIPTLLLTTLYTNSKWTLTGDEVDVFEVGAKYNFTPALQLGASYDYISPNHGKTNVIFQGMHHQINTSADYFLSKATDVYVAASYQKAESGYAARIAQMSPTDLATSHQYLIEIGIRHKF